MLSQLKHTNPPKNSAVRYALAVAIAGSILKRHTPNFGWCGLFPSLDKLLAESHGSLFRNVLGSVLRPSLHIEKSLGHACGMTCVNGYYYLAYFAALLTSLLLTTPHLFRIAGMGNECERRWASRILWALPIYLIIFSYGSIVDAIFPMSIICLSRLLLEGRRNIRFSQSQLANNLLAFTLFTILTFLADMTRPYAPYVLLFMAAAAAAQRSSRAFIGIALGVTLALPYHINQQQATGSPILTNYTGCNLIEVFRAPGVIPAGSMTTTPQLEIAQLCKENATKVVQYIKSQPVSALGDLISPIRLARTAWPAPFTPWEYSIAPGFRSPEEIAQWALWLALIIFLYIPATRLSAGQVSQMFFRGASEAILSIAIFLPMAFSIIGHGGQEAGRVGMTFVLPIIFYTSYLCASKITVRAGSN